MGFGTRHISEWPLSTDVEPILGIEVRGAMRRSMAAATDSASLSQLGQASDKPAHVVVISDFDVIMDDYFALHWAVDRRLDGQSLQRVFAEAGNVHVVANAVDYLLNNSLDRTAIATKPPAPIDAN